MRDMRDKSARARGLTAWRGLTFFETECDEAVCRIVGRKTNRDSVTGDHPNSKAPHPAGQLSRNLLSIFEGNLIAATAKNLVDTSGRLYQVISCQIESILPTLDRGRTEVSPADRTLPQ